MKDGLTEIVAVLDRSGSMASLTGDTIGGYNAFLQEQRGVEGEAVLSTVLFNDKPEKVLHNRVNIKDVPPISEKDYRAGGCTALIDALGRAIDHIGRVLDKTPEGEKPSKVIFFVITDGLENSSREYSYERVKQMVELQRNVYNWEFIFMGANIDAFDAAESIGIRRDRAFNYDAEDVWDAHHAWSGAVCNYRLHGNVDEGVDFRGRLDARRKNAHHSKSGANEKSGVN